MRLKLFFTQILLLFLTVQRVVASLRPLRKLPRGSKLVRCGLSHFKGPAERIVGGRIARDGEFPWTVSVHSNGHFKCGGSILDNFHILTAAHCLQRAKPSEVTIRYNSLFYYGEGNQRSASK